MAALAQTYSMLSYLIHPPSAVCDMKLKLNWRNIFNSRRNDNNANNNNPTHNDVLGMFNYIGWYSKTNKMRWVKIPIFICDGRLIKSKISGAYVRDSSRGWLQGWGWVWGWEPRQTVRRHLRWVDLSAAFIAGCWRFLTRDKTTFNCTWGWAM